MHTTRHTRRFQWCFRQQPEKGQGFRNKTKQKSSTSATPGSKQLAKVNNQGCRPVIYKYPGGNSVNSV